MNGDGRTHIHRMIFGARIFTVSFCMLPLHAQATQISVGAGHGNAVQVLSVGAGTPAWMSGEADHWSWAVAGEWQLARWSSDHPGAGVETLADGSLTAVMTLRHAAWQVAYLEAGFGVHLLTQDRIGEDRDLGWCFQFGEFIGAGVNAGSRGQYAIGVRLRHVSNGSLNSQNDGLTLVQGVLRYRF